MSSREETTELLQKLLLEAASGNSSSHNRLIERASARLMELTRKMIRAEFPRLKRWEETSDVFQDAVLKLYRSLEDVRPESLRGFFGLAATQVNVHRRLLVADVSDVRSGQLVLVNLMRPAPRLLEEQMAEAWVGFQGASQLEAPLELLEPLTHGAHPVGLARLTALVNAAGFGDPARVFQALDYEGFLLQRSS